MTHDVEWTTADDALRALVARAADRDPEAWDQLYRRAYRRLYGYARRRLYDDQSAEDAVSETMTRALDSIDRFTWQGAGIDAWLYGIARNVVFELGRSQRRTAAVVPDEAVQTERGPAEHAVASDERAAIRRAFDQLSSDEQELLELRVHGGLSSEEVGQLLGKQPGAVRMAQARALQRLRTILGEVHGVD